jgi:opacity protein-like surface antigen
MASAGMSWSLSQRATLDLAYRYTDLGDVRTDAGPAAIVRAVRTIPLDIAPTHANLVVQGVSASVRWAF